jgi:hypothetical protein
MLKKMLTSLKNAEKKMFATFPKNVDEKILTIVQKIINKKKVKTRGFLGSESVKWAVFGLRGLL